MTQKENLPIWQIYIGRIILIGIPLIGFIWFNYYTWKIYHDDNRLDKNGIETTAKLIDRYYNDGGRGTEIHKLTLEYKPTKAIHKEKRIIQMNVHPTIYNLSGIDEDRIPILYFADDPDIIKIKGVKPSIHFWVICIVVDFIVLIAIFYDVFSHFREKRNPPQVE